jgi:ribosomal protein L16/L10AE
MGTYGLEGVLLAWKQGSLTSEQAVGQILQLIQQLEKRVAELERRVYPTHLPLKKPGEDRVPGQK